MGSQSRDVLLALVGRGGVADCRAGQRPVEVIFRRFHSESRYPEQRLRPRCGIHGRCIVTCKKARLQLASPIGELGTRQIRVTGQTALDPKLVKLRIVKGAEFRRKSPESPDQPKLDGDEVDNHPEPRLLGKRETVLGFALHLGKRVADGEKVRGQGVATVRAEGQVAVLVRHLERPTQQIAASLDMSRPGEDVSSKLVIDPGLETPQSALLDQLITELAEAKTGPIIAKTRAGDRAKHYVREGRAVAVTALEAEIDCSTDDQASQVGLCVHSCSKHLGQNIQSREGGRVGHHGQINELLDRPAPEL